MSAQVDAIIVGGGVIGCSAAYYLSLKGLKVMLLEKGRIGQEASGAAAGMLGAQSELTEDGPLWKLARYSRDLFPRLAEELRELSGIDIALVQRCMLKVAVTEQDAAELKRLLDLQQQAGEEAAWIGAAEAREREPSLTPAVLGALYLPCEGHVLAPRLTAAFAGAAAALGAELREYADVRSLLTEGKRVIGVSTAGDAVHAGSVVLAAGVWSGTLAGPLGLSLPLYPVQGECLCLRSRKPLLRSTVAAPGGCYLVPKAGSRMVVGATEHEGVFTRRVTAAGVASLLARARELVPALEEAEWERAWSGLRPQTPDGLPYIGPVAEYPGLYVAAGHFRNGILLSPVTGRYIAGLVVEEDTGEDVEFWSDFHPDRRSGHVEKAL
ncbi:glycine oxidase ThiO [Paenibacillus larvae]|uniref:glycine oxidase ThiO n=1 Tax=Paenibacillus larvae TaxID=1464 RepID=UPI00227FE7EA|nr:glycine oxidase ThiO [Paenibacillus larvae]MCY9509769.1 glycine oxidase ThiO [Paenibacillus larvae]MCY9525700.1 glycine oxidase ThiO [Paenibacillus larvae]